MILMRLEAFFQGGALRSLALSGLCTKQCMWSARKKSFEILYDGRELNPGHRKERQWAIPLSYHDPAHREDRQWAIPLSYHDPGGHRRRDSELSHWAIMTLPTGRTDSELFHWAIMTRATGKRDSELPTELSWLTVVCRWTEVRESILTKQRLGRTQYWYNHESEKALRVLRWCMQIFLYRVISTESFSRDKKSECQLPKVL